MYSDVALECAGYINTLNGDDGVSVMNRTDVFLRGFDRQMSNMVSLTRDTFGLRIDISGRL